MADKVEEIKLKTLPVLNLLFFLSERSYLVLYFDSMKNKRDRIFIAVAL